MVAESYMVALRFESCPDYQQIKCCAGVPVLRKINKGVSQVAELVRRTVLKFATQVTLFS